MPCRSSRSRQRWIVGSDPDEVVAKSSSTWAGLNHLVFHAPGHDQRRFLELFEQDLAPRSGGCVVNSCATFRTKTRTGFKLGVEHSRSRTCSAA